MSELKNLSSINKSLKKQLNRSYLTLYYQVDFYLRLYDLTIVQYKELTNQILLNFNQWAKEGKDVWETIGDPKQFVEKKLTNYEVKGSSFIITILRRYIPIFLGLVSMMIIVSNFFNLSNLSIFATLIFDLSYVSIFDNLIRVSFYICLFLIYYWTLFKRDKRMVVYALILLLIYIFSTMYIQGMNATNGIILTIPMMFIYIIFGLSVFVKAIDRKKIWI